MRLKIELCLDKNVATWHSNIIKQHVWNADDLFTYRVYKHNTEFVHVDPVYERRYPF